MMRDDPALRRYLDSLAVASVESRRPWLESFFNYARVSPAEVVEWQRGHPGDYRFVDLAYEWLKDSELLVSSKKTKMGCVRGFFLANRCPLPFDRHKFRSEKVPVVAEMAVEDLRKVIVASNPDMAAAFMVQFQSGSGAGELRYINEHHASHVWDEVRRGAKIIRLVMPGRKAKRNVQPYYTFVGLDSVELLKRLFHSRGWKRDSVLFRTKQGNPISGHSINQYFRQKAFKLGLIKAKTPRCLECGGETVKRMEWVDGREKVFYLCVECGLKRRSSDYGLSHKVLSGVRYRMKTHELRDLFRTEWHRAQRIFGVDGDVCEFLMGHTIDPLKYDKIMKDVEATRQQYRRAMPMLNILSEDPRKISRSEVQDQLEASEAKVDALGRQLAELRRDSQSFHEIVEVLRDPTKMKKFKKILTE